MYLHLNESDAKFVQAILLEKQIELCNRCEELLKDPEFNAAMYKSVDFSERRLARILDDFS